MDDVAKHGHDQVRDNDQGFNGAMAMVIDAPHSASGDDSVWEVINDGETNLPVSGKELALATLSSSSSAAAAAVNGVNANDENEEEDEEEEEKRRREEMKAAFGIDSSSDDDR